jgi:hypothetical protein
MQLHGKATQCKDYVQVASNIKCTASACCTDWPLPSAHLSPAAASLVLLLPLPLPPAPLLLQLGGATVLSASLIILNLSSLSALVVVVSEGDAFTCTSKRQAQQHNGKHIMGSHSVEGG